MPGQLIGSVAVPEIVQVLGRVGAEEGELGGVGVALGPEVQRLAADDERTIIELEDRGELADNLGR